MSVLDNRGCEKKRVGNPRSQRTLFLHTHTSTGPTAIDVYSQDSQDCYIAASNTSFFFSLLFVSVVLCLLLPFSRVHLTLSYLGAWLLSSYLACGPPVSHLATRAAPLCLYFRGLWLAAISFLHLSLPLSLLVSVLGLSNSFSARSFLKGKFQRVDSCPNQVVPFHFNFGLMGQPEK